MKKILCCLLLAVAAMVTAGCGDDEPTPFDKQLLEGQWYAEVPMTGQVENLRSEQGETTAYDHIGVIMRLNTLYGSGHWLHAYLSGGTMVNFDGYDAGDNGNGAFDFSVSADGHITIDRFLQGTPRPVNIRYADGTILADMDGQTIVFRPAGDAQQALVSEILDILTEMGEIGGYVDNGQKVSTDVDATGATTPARARTIAW